MEILIHTTRPKYFVTIANFKMKMIKLEFEYFNIHFLQISIIFSIPNAIFCIIIIRFMMIVRLAMILHSMYIKTNEKVYTK